MISSVYMKHKIIAIFFYLLLIIPFGAVAAETGIITENFSGTGRRNDRNTYAFWDTRNKSVGLPLRYTFQNLTSIGNDMTNPDTQLKFQGDIAAQFSRIPVGRIQNNALVFSDGNFLYVLSRGIVYTNLGGGIELSNGRIPELNNTDIRVLSTLPGKIYLSGKTRGKPFLAEIAVEGFITSSAVEFKKIADAGSGKFFKKAKVDVEADVPEGAQIEYMLSADGGAHYEAVAPGLYREFIHKGGDLRFKAVLVTNNATRTPYILKLTIAYEKAQIENLAALRNRDNKRVNDLKDIANRLERFKKDRGVYPIVNDQSASARWEQMGRLLIDGKYITTLQDDPKKSEETDRTYDYIPATSGQSYILRALLEETNNKNLEKDVDEKAIEPNVYDYSCVDTWYCLGKGFTVVNLPPQIAPMSAGTAEILQDENGRVWRIASVGGGAEPIVQRKLYIPSPSVLTKLKNFYARMRKVGNETIAQYERARLVKTEDKNDIYYITATFLKRLIPNQQVFESYGNKMSEVVIVKSEELAAYGDSRLIRLIGDKRVWYLEGGTRRLVLSPAVMRKRGFKWEQVAPVNWAEYNSYPEGALLE